MIPMNLTSIEVDELNESIGSEGVCISDDDTETFQIANESRLENADEFIDQQQFGEIDVENVSGSIARTTIRFCNTATQTDLAILSPNSSGVNSSTQTDITWPKVEKERNHAQATIKALSAQLGGIVVENDEDGSGDETSSTDDEENFSDASDDTKLYDNAFSAKNGYNVNVRVTLMMILCDDIVLN